MSDRHRVPVTESLRARIEEIRGSESWRKTFNEWWPVSHTTAWKIGEGKQATTSPAVYHALGLEPPRVLHITLTEGAALFGKVGLLQSDLAENVRLLVLESQDLEGYEMRPCAVCGDEFFAPCWLGRKYCRRHDSRSAWYRSKAGKEWRKKRV